MRHEITLALTTSHIEFISKSNYALNMAECAEPNLSLNFFIQLPKPLTRAPCTHGGRAGARACVSVCLFFELTSFHI